MLCANVAHQGPFAGKYAGVCAVFPVAKEIAVIFAEMENGVSEVRVF
jgi:hypothetical protein